MEPAVPQASSNSTILTHLARQVLILQLTKLKQQQQQQLKEQQAKAHQDLKLLPAAEPAPARAPSPPAAAADYVTTKPPARQSIKPWLPGGSPSSAWGRNKANSDVGSAAQARGRSASRRCTSAPGARHSGRDQQQQDDTSTWEPSGSYNKADRSPGAGASPQRPTRHSSPRKSSVSPRPQPSPSTASKSPGSASRGGSSPGRFPSPLREASTAGYAMDASPARLDSSAGNGGFSSSNGTSPFDSINGCAGPGRLPYHEALQIAYGPPAPSVLKTHLDLTASGAKASGPRQHYGSNSGSGGGDGSGHDSQAVPLLPRRRRSASSTRGSQHDSGASIAAPGAAAAAAMGAALAAATAAAALMSRRAQPEPVAVSTSQELLKGYTTGYIDGRLAALRGSGGGIDSNSSSSPSHDSAPAPAPAAAESVQSPGARLSTSSSLSFAAVGRSGSPSQLTHAPSPDEFFLQANDASPNPASVAKPSSSSAPGTEVAAVAGEQRRPAIRPELVKQIAMKIVSAALASPDKLGTQAANTAAAAATTPAPTDPKAAAQTLMQANPGQLRSLLEQMQKVLPPQRQRSTSPTAQMPSPRLLLPTQQWQLQQQMLGWKEDCLPEFSVSAFDRETDTYLIPVTHIGCQTSEVFSDRDPVRQTEQSADAGPTRGAGVAETRATATASSASSSAGNRTTVSSIGGHAAHEVKSADGTSNNQADAAGSGAGLLLVCDAPSSGFVSMHQQQQQQLQPRVNELQQTEDQGDHGVPPLGVLLQLQQQQQPSPAPAQQTQQHQAAPNTLDSVYQSLQVQVEAASAASAACGANPADTADAVSPGVGTKTSLARIEELLQAMHSRAQQQLTTAQQLKGQAQAANTAEAQAKQQQELKQLLQPMLGQQQDQQQQQLGQSPASLAPIRTKAADTASPAGAGPPSFAAAAVSTPAAAVPALEPRSPLKLNMDRPLSPTGGTGSLVGLQVLERLLSELHVLQSSVKRHAAVDQLELGRLDALMAQVALLNHWLVERCGTGHPVSAQLALLQQDLQAWRSRVGADLVLQPHGPPSPPPATRPTSSWGPSSPHSPVRADSVSPRGPYQGAPLSPRTLLLQQQWLSTTAAAAAAAAAAPAGPGSPRNAVSSSGQRQLQPPQQPQQQLLAPILSGGLMRSRSMPIYATHWPPGALPPVQEGRESECDTASSVGDVSSVHSMQSSMGASLTGRSGSMSTGSGSISLILKPQQRGLNTKPKSILATLDTSSSNQEALRSGGSSGGGSNGNRRRSSSAGDTGSSHVNDRGQGTQGLAPYTARQQAQEQQHSGALGFLKPSGWLSPRSRGASMEQPRPTAGTRSSMDAYRAQRSPKKNPLASRSLGYEPGTQPAFVKGPAVRRSNGSSGGGGGSGGGGSPSSVQEKKRGFMLALKQTLQENMQHLGGSKKAAAAGRSSSGGGGSARMNARQLTAEALQIVAHER